jgi:hypothetical protein
MICLVDEPGSKTEEIELKAGRLWVQFFQPEGSFRFPAQRISSTLFKAMLIQRAEIEAISDELIRVALSRWVENDEGGKLKRDRHGVAKIHGVPGTMFALLGPIQDQRFLDSQNAALMKGSLGSKGIGNYLVGADQDRKSDLLATANEGMWREYTQRKESIADLVPSRVELSPLPGLHVVPNRWNWPLFHAENIRNDIASYEPIFSDESDLQFRNAARQSIRDKFEQDDAKKRGGTGGRHVEATGRAEEAIFEDIPVEELPSERADPASRVNAAQIVAAAGKHLGSNAERYFEVVARPGSTQKDAAKAASISDSMARRYQREMRKLLGG